MNRFPTAALAAAALIASLAACAHAIPAPAVPAGLEVDSTHKAFLVGHAVGTQNYVCLPSATSTTGVAWTLFGPQATLFADRDRQLATHFLSPNPDEAGVARATWQAQDGSATWAKRVDQSSDAEYVAPDAIPWFLLQVVGNEAGASGGRKLSDTTWVQRVNTVGGRAPATGCGEAGNLGAIQLVPYEADYYFYKPTRR
jgi:hypothetical protein